MHSHGLRPGRRFRRKYYSIFKKDPLSANLFLLLSELAGPDGKVSMPPDPRKLEKELEQLISIRFKDPFGYQL
jgi:hypothetical protein